MLCLVAAVRRYLYATQTTLGDMLFVNVSMTPCSKACSSSVVRSVIKSSWPVVYPCPHDIQKCTAVSIVFSNYILISKLGFWRSNRVLEACYLGPFGLVVLSLVS